MEQSIAFAPQLDDRQLDREVTKIDQRLSKVDETIRPDVDASGIDGVSNGIGAGGGESSGMGVGGAAGGGALGAALPKPVSGVLSSKAVPMALVGGVGVGILSAMRSSSNRMQTSASLLGQAWSNFWRPIGDEVDQLFVRDPVLDLVDATRSFEETYRSGNRQAAIVGLLTDLETDFGAVSTALDVLLKGGRQAVAEKIAEWIAGRFEWPSLPSFSWPSLPSFSWPSLPSFSWPSLPSFSWPSLPRFSWPNIGMPDVPDWSTLAPSLPRWTGLHPDIPDWRGLSPGVPDWRDFSPGVPDWRGLLPGLPDWRDLVPDLPDWISRNGGGSGGSGTPPQTDTGGGTPPSGDSGGGRTPIFGGGGGGRSGVGDDTAPLRPMARGGLVRGPTPVLAGESGPEVVQPLSEFERVIDRVARMGGGDNAELIREIRSMKNELSREFRRAAQSGTITLEVDGETLGRIVNDRQSNRINDTNPLA